jgi:hypothetical protein
VVVGASDDDGTEPGDVSTGDGSLVGGCVVAVEPVVEPLPEQPISTATPTSIETDRRTTSARLITPQ